MADALEKQIATPYGVGVGGRGSCLICGGPEPFGLSVCPSCGGVAETVCRELALQGVRELIELLDDIEAHAEAQHEVEALVAEVSAK